MAGRAGFGSSAARKGQQAKVPTKEATSRIERRKCEVFMESVLSRLPVKAMLFIPTLQQARAKWLRHDEQRGGRGVVHVVHLPLQGRQFQAVFARQPEQVGVSPLTMAAERAEGNAGERLVVWKKRVLGRLGEVAQCRKGIGHRHAR